MWWFAMEFSELNGSGALRKSHPGLFCKNRNWKRTIKMQHSFVTAKIKNYSDKSAKAQIIHCTLYARKAMSRQREFNRNTSQIKTGGGSQCEIKVTTP